MRNFTMPPVMAICLLFTISTRAQRVTSIDLAGIRNTAHGMNGVNVSGFYHFTPRLIAGVEMNRFFPVHKTVKEETVSSSAWDFDFNVHYLLPILPHLRFYPITGISHTSEKETNSLSGESVYERFWSYNAGAGLLMGIGKWSPHIEYLFTWGKMHQQFLLAGISYEIEWGREKNKKADKE